ncbi:Hypothetical predicted protein, partial [Olea europaea subsp. europaea]
MARCGIYKGRNLTEAELALLSDCWLKESVIKELIETNYEEHLLELENLEQRYPSNKYIQRAVAKYKQNGKIITSKANKSHLFAAYEKIRYFFVPFIQAPEMEERVMRNMQAGVSSAMAKLEEMKNRTKRHDSDSAETTTLTPDTTTTTTTASPGEQIKRYSVYDTINDT